MPAKINLLIPLILLLVTINGKAWTDSRDLLQQLPSQWQGKLEPIPDNAKKSGLDSSTREKISQARWQVVQMLSQASMSQQELSHAYARLGAYYLHYFIYTLAELSYTNAARLDPNDFRWIYYLAFIAQYTGRPDIALKRYARARTLDNNFPPLDLRVADIYLNQNQLDAAKQAYQRAVGKKEFAAPAEYGLGQIALLQKDYNAAVAHFEKVLQLDPHATQTHYPLAQAYRALKQNDLARQHLSQHAKGKPEIDDPLIETIRKLEQAAALHFKSAVIAINQQQYDAALNEFAAGLELDPDNGAAHVSYARVLYLSGEQISRVKQELQHALTLDSNNTLALFLLGVLAEDEANNTEAQEYYQKILQIDPEHAGAHFFLAEHLFDTQDYASACPHYRKTIALEPMNVHAQMKYLGCMNYLGEADSALYAQLESLSRRFPDVSLLSYVQIHILALSHDSTLRNTEKALVLAEQLAGSQPIPPHLGVLALVEAASGNFQQAVKIQQSLIRSEEKADYPFLAAQQRLELYQQGKLPVLDNSLSETLFSQRSPIDPTIPFRYYPAPRPY